MATKQEKALQRALLKGKKQGKVREEKHALSLLTAVIVVLLYLLLAQHNGWWPYMRPLLGSAFYTNVSGSTTAPNSGSTSKGSTSGTSSTSGGNGDTSGGTGSTGTGSTPASGSGGSTGSSSGTTPIATFAAGVNVGDTQSQVGAQATGLSQNCAVVVSASAPNAGQQQVCTYTEGNKIVTVTYLNNRVISASKSGF